MLTTSRLRKSRTLRLLTWAVMTHVAFLSGPMAWALPSGANVQSGDIRMITVRNTMLIKQDSGSAIINWSGFDIAGNETVRFLQPGPGSAVLNRIGGGQTEIAGRLLANGQVYLINPNGILFTSSAKIDVGGLVASGLNMTDSDFMSRRLHFEGGGGSVINEGNISAGRVTLVGGVVENHGHIGAGSVTLAAGSQSVLIDRAGDGQISITVDGVGEPTALPVETNVTYDADGRPIKDTAPVDPGREVSAELDAYTWVSPVTTNGLVYNWGTITSPGELGGRISLQGVRVAQYGEIRADATTAIGDGGTINIKANDLILFSPESITTANALERGNGGTINIIANGTLSIPEGAVLEQKGGSKSGDGGFLETSGHGGVVLGVKPSAKAPNGKDGTWVIDPPNFYIDNGGDRKECDFWFFGCEYPWEVVGSGSLKAAIPNGGTGYLDIDDVNDFLNDYGAVQVRTFQVGGGGAGDIVVSDGVYVDGVGEPRIFALWSHGSIFLNAPIYDSSGSDDRINVILQSQYGQVQVNAGIETSGGYVFINSGGGASDGHAFINGAINTGGGNVYVISTNAAVVVEAGGSINAGGGEVLLASTKDGVWVEGAVAGNHVTVSGKLISMAAGGDITSSGDAILASKTYIDMANGSTVVSSSGDVALKAPSWADVTGLRANNGLVVVASSSISDAGDSARDVAGNRALLVATNGTVGWYDNLIDTDVDILGGVAKGGFFGVSEANGLTIDTVGGATLSAVLPDGSNLASDKFTNIVVGAYTNGIISQGVGDVVIHVENGNLTVNDLVAQGGNGNVTLEATGAGGDVTINYAVGAKNGNVKVTANDTVVQNSYIAATNSGNVLVEAVNGNIQMIGPDAVGFAQNGNIRYRAGGNIDSGLLVTKQGSLSVSAGGSLNQNSNLYAIKNGTIDVDVGGNIVMKSNTLTFADGNVRYHSGGNTRLAMIAVTNASAGITIDANGSILDNNIGGVNIVAPKVTLRAGNSIGTLGAGIDDPIEMGVSRLAAQAGAGGMNIVNGGDLQVTSVTIGDIKRVGSSGSTSLTGGSTLNGLTTTGGGSIVLADRGRVNVASPITASGNGDIFIATQNGALGTTGVVITSAPLNISNVISSASGDITLVATGGELKQSAAGDIQTVGGSIVVLALSNRIFMADGAETRSFGGGIVYLAKSNILVGSINSGTGTASAVSLTGDILDNGDLQRDFVGGLAQLIAPQGSVGTSFNRIDTSVDRLSGFSGDGGFYISEANNVTIDNVGPNIVRFVNNDGTISLTNIPAINGIAASNGPVLVQSEAGSITVNAPVVALGPGSQNVELDANGGASDLNINAIVATAMGNILLTAGHNITQSTNIYALTNGYVVAEAEGGSIIMTTGALTFASSGNIRYHAAQNATIGSLITTTGSVTVLAGQNVTVLSNVFALTGGTLDLEAQGGSLTMSSNMMGIAGGNIRAKGNQNVTIGSLISTSANVSVIATFGSILDGGSANPEIVAASAQLSALRGGVGQFGSTTNALEVAVGTIAARGGPGGINVLNGGNVTVGTVAAIPVQRVNSNGTTSTIGGSTMSGLITSNGGSIVFAARGTLEIDQMVQANGTGNVLLASQTGLLGSNNISVATFTIKTNVSSTLGNITVASLGGDIEQWATGDITTTNGHIVIAAPSNEVHMANGARAVAQGGNILVAAATNAVIGNLNAGTGMVSIISKGGNILDGGDFDTEVIAAGLQVIAPSGTVGSVANRFETDVDRLEGVAGGGGIFISEDDDLIIGGVGAVPVNIVGIGSKISTTNISALGVLAVTNLGDIVVETVQGSIDIQAVVGNLSQGNTRIYAGGGGSDLAINNTVVSHQGAITLIAEDNILQTTSIVAQTTGTIDVEARGGRIVMTNDALTAAETSNIFYKAYGDVLLGSLISTQGDVAVVSTLGSILDGGGSLPEILALRASLMATNGGIGTLGAGTDDAIETGVGTLAARAGLNGVNIANGGDMIIGAVPTVIVQRVLSDATLVDQAAAPQNGVSTIDAGTIIVANLGKLTVDEQVSANGDGDVLLVTKSGPIGTNIVITNATITLNTNVMSGSGIISVIAEHDVIQNADGDISTLGGDIGVLAKGGDIRMADGAFANSGGGNILYFATTNLLLGGLNAGTGSVVAAATGGSIYDSGDAYTNVEAHDLQLLATIGAVGQPSNGIETAVDRIAAFAGNGGVRVTELDDVEIGTIGPIDGRVVLPDGTLTTTGTPALVGIIVTNGSILFDTVHGSIVATSIVVNAGDGNILLDARGAGSSLVVSNLVLANNGNISLLASNNVFQYGDVLSTGTGSIDVDAGEGSIWMSDSNYTAAGNGVVRYHAASNVTISSLISASNTVSIIADKGSILDGGDSRLDVIGPRLRMEAFVGAGTEDNPLDTLIGFISSRAGTGGVNVVNEGILVVDEIPDATIQRVLTNDVLWAITDVAQSDIVTTNGGGVELTAKTGGIVVFDGQSPDDNVGIHTDGAGEICLHALGSNNYVIIDADLTSVAGDISAVATGDIIINTNVDFISTGKRGSIALWADSDNDGEGDYLQLGGNVKTRNGDIFVAGVNIYLLKRSKITSLTGDISLKADKKIQLSRTSKVTTQYGRLVMDAGKIKIDTTVKGGTVAVRARTGSISGKGTVIGTQAVSLDARTDIGSAKDPFNVDAGTLAAITKSGDIYLIEENSARAGDVAAIFFPNRVIPECASNIPTATSRDVSGVESAGFLQLTVNGNFGGNRVVAGGDAVVDVGGSVNELDLLQAGGNIDLTVGDNYSGKEIIAGGDLTAEIGKRFEFDLIEADNVLVNAGDIYMSRVIAGGDAEFNSTGTIFDDGSYIRARDVILTARGDIGPNKPIQLDVNKIDVIKAGGDATFVQQRPGDTPVNRLEAGGRLSGSFPNGGIIDRNGGDRNVIAGSAYLNAQHMGTLTDPLEVAIGPGNLEVNGGGISGADTPEDYIFVHMNGTIGKDNDRKIDYVGDLEIPGFIIFNGQILGGKDYLLRRFARAYAFLTDAPVIARPEGYLDDPWFISMDTPTTESWEIFLHFIQRDQAEISAGAKILPPGAPVRIRVGESSRPFSVRGASASAR